MRSLFPVLSLLGLLHHVCALRFDVSIRQRRPTTLVSRANGQNAIPVANTRNSEYIANITLGGRQIPVLLDTGSSDLWVTGSVPNSKDLGKSLSLSYAVGKASGDVYTAKMDFAGYTVEDQAFLLVEDTGSFSVDIKSQGYEGLIGLGPNTGSVIRDKIDDARGDSVLDRIFTQNATAANFLTILLNREGDPQSPATGQLTISEVLSNYSKVTSMPKLPVTKVHKLTDEDQHWQVYTDVNGIIGPDGKPIEIESIVPKAPDGQLVVVFDSGFTLPQVPRAMADAIYGRVPGAEYNEANEIWTVPCDQLIPLTFKFGGIEYPIHPLDVSSDAFAMLDSRGNPVCAGTFQPITSAFSLLGEYDIILGMAFMRNTYTLLDYGNFLKHTANDRGDPFVQLLPLTDAAQAHQDFVQLRLNGVDTSGDAAHALLPVDQMQHSPISKEEKKKKYAEMVLSRWPYIFVGCLAFVIIVIGLITWRCCVRRRRQREAKAAKLRILNAGSPPRSPGAQPISFARLEQGMLPQQMEMHESKGGYDYRPSFSSNRGHV
ncbi:acid protease [Trametes polyzona]|nr:acid protease [Trametes polyzona]